jgi:hypothetical protein
MATSGNEHISYFVLIWAYFDLFWLIHNFHTMQRQYQARYCYSQRTVGQIASQIILIFIIEYITLLWTSLQNSEKKK